MIASSADARGQTTAITFTRDVAPILQRSCQHCHRPGSIAPMPLMSYEDVRPWARAIRLRVSQREMPPWHMDKTIGIKKFKDDPWLTDQEIATIVSWIDGGMARGNPADMPPPRELADWEWWNIGKPDLIVTLPEDVTIPPQGPTGGPTSGPTPDSPRIATSKPLK